MLANPNSRFTYLAISVERVSLLLSTTCSRIDSVVLDQRPETINSKYVYISMSYFCHQQAFVQISSCPNCRKPLPRCAICLVHMGTPSGARLGRLPQDEKLSEFNSWFTWCQSCRHGGHVSHMTQWFREHLECPVTACNCRCMSLDAAAPLR